MEQSLLSASPAKAAQWLIVVYSLFLVLLLVAAAGTWLTLSYPLGNVNRKGWFIGAYHFSLSNLRDVNSVGTLVSFSIGLSFICGASALLGALLIWPLDKLSNVRSKLGVYGAVLAPVFALTGCVWYLFWYIFNDYCDTDIMINEFRSCSLGYAWFCFAVACFFSLVGFGMWYKFNKAGKFGDTVAIK